MILRARCLAEVRAASLWTILVAAILQLFLATGFSSARQLDLSPILASTPLPPSLDEVRQMVEPDVWRRNVKAKPPAQAKFSAARVRVPAVGVPFGRIMRSAHECRPLIASAARFFNPRGPPLPSAVA